MIELCEQLTPVGEVRIAAKGEKLVGLAFLDGWPRIERHLARWFPDEQVRPLNRPNEVARRLDAYMAGELNALAGIPLETAGTSFQRRPRRLWRRDRTQGVAAGARAPARSLAGSVAGGRGRLPGRTGRSGDQGRRGAAGAHGWPGQGGDQGDRAGASPGLTDVGHGEVGCAEGRGGWFGCGRGDRSSRPMSTLSAPAPGPPDPARPAHLLDARGAFLARMLSSGELTPRQTAWPSPQACGGLPDLAQATAAVDRPAEAPAPVTPAAMVTGCIATASPQRGSRSRHAIGWTSVW
jgi:6-O-methylguanine DNA methyltransferase-like protein